MPRPNGFSQILWLLASPLVAHDMGSKDPANFLCWVERITNQAWWFFANPHVRFTVPASCLSKQFSRLEDNLIPYDEVCCPGQFV